MAQKGDNDEGKHEQRANSHSHYRLSNFLACPRRDDLFTGYFEIHKNDDATHQEVAADE